MLLTVFDNGATKTPAANLTNFGGILSRPEAFYALNSSISFLTFLVVVYGIEGIY